MKLLKLVLLLIVSSITMASFGPFSSLDVNFLKLEGDQGCENISISSFNKELKISFGKYTILDSISEVSISNSKVSLGKNKLKLVKTQKNDSRINKYVPGTSRLTLVVVKKNHLISEVKYSYEYRSFLSPFYKTIEEINCKK